MADVKGKTVIGRINEIREVAREFRNLLTHPAFEEHGWDGSPFTSGHRSATFNCAQAVHGRLNALAEEYVSLMRRIGDVRDRTSIRSDILS